MLTQISNICKSDLCGINGKKIKIQASKLNEIIKYTHKNQVDMVLSELKGDITKQVMDTKAKWLVKIRK